MQRQRVAADYLQTSAIIAPDGTVVSAVNDANVYTGPGTGYRLEGERWERLQQLPYTIDARLLGARRTRPRAGRGARRRRARRADRTRS